MKKKMKSFSIVPIIISQKKLDQWSENLVVKPHLLDVEAGINSITRDTVVRALKHISFNSNEHLIKSINDVLRYRFSLNCVKDKRKLSLLTWDGEKIRLE